MLSRRRFLSASAAAALVPRLLAPGRGDARTSSEFSRQDPVAGLVARHPGRPGEGAASVCPDGGVLARCLRAGRLTTFEVGANGGSPDWQHAIETLRGRTRQDVPLGLVCWGAPDILPTAMLREGVFEAVVLLDLVDLPVPDSAVGRNVLWHLGSRRSPAERRTILRRVASLERAGTPLIHHWYEAAPGFAAPGRARSDRAAALAWQRTAAFLERQLGRSAAGRALMIG